VPLTELGRLFMYTRNKSGPSGTPDVTGAVEDDSPSTTTLWGWFRTKL
jgi:hypothetical protein